MVNGYMARPRMATVKTSRRVKPAGSATSVPGKAELYPNRCRITSPGTSMPSGPSSGAQYGPTGLTPRNPPGTSMAPRTTLMRWMASAVAMPCLWATAPILKFTATGRSGRRTPPTSIVSPMRASRANAAARARMRAAGTVVRGSTASGVYRPTCRRRASKAGSTSTPSTR
jgi:hypothetical protein